MAHSLRSMARCFLRRSSPIGVRTLYSNTMLGIDKFEKECEVQRQRVHDKAELFADRLIKFGKDSPQTQANIMVLSEDLKTVIKLCETDEDIELCIEMLKRYNKQNSSIRFGNFTFGTFVIRRLYMLDKPEYIMDLFNDPDLTHMLAQPSTYQIAMDLLYKHKQYHDVIGLYKGIESLQIHGFRFPRDCSVLMLASCYHLGTPEHLEFTINFIKNARRAGAKIYRKGLTFAAALAIKLQKPAVALEILALTAQMNYITVSNLRHVALSQSGRYDEIFKDFRYIIHEYHYMRQGDSEVCRDTLERIRQSLQEADSEEKLQVLKQLERGLEEGNHISKFSIEELLNLPMDQEGADSDRPTMFKGQQQMKPSETARKAWKPS